MMPSKRRRERGERLVQSLSLSHLPSQQTGLFTPTCLHFFTPYLFTLVPQRHAYRMVRVGQDRIYTPYIYTVYDRIYIHRI